MLIRRAILADAERMGYINAASWRTTYTGLISDAAFDKMTPEVMTTKWTNIISGVGNVSRFQFVAEVEGEIVGYVGCGQNRHEATSAFGWEVYALYLLKEYQGKGIGKRLMQEAIREMYDEGARSFIIYVLSTNLPARRFYESFKPDFTTEQKITIDGIEYDDTGYGWSDITRLLA